MYDELYSHVPALKRHQLTVAHTHTHHAWLRNPSSALCAAHQE